MSSHSHSHYTTRSRFPATTIRPRSMLAIPLPKPKKRKHNASNRTVSTSRNATVVGIDARRPTCNPRRRRLTRSRTRRLPSPPRHPPLRRLGLSRFDDTNDPRRHGNTVAAIGLVEWISNPIAKSTLQTRGVAHKGSRYD